MNNKQLTTRVKTPAKTEKKILLNYTVWHRCTTYSQTLLL